MFTCLLFRELNKTAKLKDANMGLTVTDDLCVGILCFEFAKKGDKK